MQSNTPVESGPLRGTIWMEKGESDCKGHIPTVFHTSRWPCRSHTDLILVCVCVCVCVCVWNSGRGQNP